MQTKNFYVDLDSIFDIRLNVIERIDPQAPARLIANKYHKRQADYFEGIDPETFRALYDEYSFENLQGCVKTNIFQFLADTCFDVIKETIALEIDLNDRPKLEINVWPYELTEQEQRILRALAFAELGGKIEVLVVNIDLKDMAPQQCQNRYFFMVMYHYYRWINAQADALAKAFYPTLVLVGPQIIFERDPAVDDELHDLLESGINPLAVLEAGIAPRITLRLISPEVFSIVYPDNRLLSRTQADETGMSLESFQRILDKQKEIQEGVKR